MLDKLQQMAVIIDNSLETTEKQIRNIVSAFSEEKWKKSYSSHYKQRVKELTANTKILLEGLPSLVRFFNSVVSKVHINAPTSLLWNCFMYIPKMIGAFLVVSSLLFVYAYFAFILLSNKLECK